MDYVAVDRHTRSAATALLLERWHSPIMVVRGQAFDLSLCDGILAMDGGHIRGLVTYRMEADFCEILSLDSLLPGMGTGRALLDRVIAAARQRGCRRVTLITTNDNTRAMRFYQRYGFDMAALHHDALNLARKIKPEIPLLGEDGIPLRHEIEFELPL